MRFLYKNDKRVCQVILEQKYFLFTMLQAKIERTTN